MNSVIKKQNDQSIIDKLSAQRNLFNKAKSIKMFRFILCVVVIVCLSIARLVWTNNVAIEVAIVIATVIALICEPLLKHWIDKYKTLAAQIQQRIDNELYGFNWDDCICGKEPSDEIICDIKSDNTDSSLHDWYDKGIGDVKEEDVAILLCQRENISYDLGLRGTYVRICASIAAILCIIVVILSFVEGWDMMKFLILGVMPAIPIAQWFISIFQDNSCDKEHLESLENLVRSETDNVIDGGIVAKKSLQKIQNLLFLHRKSGYLIPSCFYRFKRTESEKRAAYSVSEFLKKYKS